MAYFDIYFIAKDIPGILSPEWVQKQIIDPDLNEEGEYEFVLTPSFVARTPIKLLPEDATVPVDFTGRLDIECLYEGCTVRDGNICFDENTTTSTYFYDRENGVTYYPYPPLEIPLSRLRLHHDDREYFIAHVRSIIARNGHIGRLTDNGPSKASKILTARRTADRDTFVEGIMKRIEEERKHASFGCSVINHIRFIAEASVPEKLRSSVRKEVAFRIKNNFNGCYRSLSRRPKDGDPYFLQS